MKKIAIIVKTTGLEYDDRIRKVALELSKDNKVKIFVLLGDNSQSKGVTSYGVEYEAVSLKTRDMLPQKRFLSLKMLDFYFSLKKKISNYDIIWANEEATFLFPLFAKKNTFVWDLHEIPELFIDGYRKRIFQYIEKKALKILHANPQRIKYLEDKGVIEIKNKHDFIRNYPDIELIESDEKPHNHNMFIKWLENDQYVYVQGLSSPYRFPYNTITSILETTDYKIFVAGNIDKVEYEKLENKFGNKLKNRLFRAGMINQLSMPSIVRNSVFSIVLYETTKANNRLCEPNRLFQSIALGVPVVVGFNEPMKDAVGDKYGVVMKSDGSNLDELKESITKLLDNIDTYKDNCKEAKDQFIWNESCVKKEWIE